MKPLFRTLLVASATELGTALAGAQPNIVLERPDPASCVDASELSHTLADARIHAESDDAGPPHPNQRVGISIAGTPDALRITLHRHGSDTTELLPPATCASATDAVAAFLSSALGPPPAANAPVALDVLERAIGEELARRNVQLTPLGPRLLLSRDTSGGVSARLEHARTPACSQDVALGVLDEVAPETVNGAADAIARALAAHPCAEPPLPLPPAPPPGPRDQAEPERIHALSKALERVPGTKIRFLIAPVLVANGAVFTWIAVSNPAGLSSEWGFAQYHTEAQRILVGFGNGILIGGGIGTLAVGADRSLDFSRMTYLASYGLLTAGGFLAGSRFAQGATATGMLMSAGLAGLNVARPRPLTRLAADETEVDQDGLTRARAGAIERDLERADPFVPEWLALTPVFVGTSIGAIHTLAAKDRLDSFLFLFDSLWALGYGVTMASDAVQGSIAGSYRRALREIGLEQLALVPGPGAAGMSLVGRF